MARQQPEAVVAGHICLDIIPTFKTSGEIRDILVPGKLVDMGQAVTATGGPVSNTGLSLFQLGIATSLMGKVGDDPFGEIILSLLRQRDPVLAKGMIVAKGEQSSYSVVLNIPGVDRIFLHCPGANDTFRAADIDRRRLAGSRLFHFGYPPLMKRMYEKEGRECAAIFRCAKRAGLTPSLDMAKPDPASASGQAPWPRILAATLPDVDIFLPSIDEICYMLDRPRHDALVAQHGAAFQPYLDSDFLREIADRLLALGSAIVALKLGDQGLYVRTTADAKRLARLGACAPAAVAAWLNREIFTPCFKANLVGTTGSGDATIAGFLAAFLKGLSPTACAVAAVAVGACSVEAADATSGVPTWRAVQKRLRAGWERLPFRLALKGFRADQKAGVWYGPADQNAK
ncbi:MAG: carbohydrate kinase family protein [Planctomycetota bacterium]|nr:carbohydrate kinase family protein [Planctomycetota bacterium]